jgi:hypothetical protein
VLDADALQQDPIAEAFFGSSPIVALDWNPNALGLAFVCDRTAVCFWNANTGAAAHQAFQPPVRFEGHTMKLGA